MVLFLPHSVGEQVCDVLHSHGLLPVTCLMVSQHISRDHEESVWPIDEAEISRGELSPLGPLGLFSFIRSGFSQVPSRLLTGKESFLSGLGSPNATWNDSQT